MKTGRHILLARIVGTVISEAYVELQIFAELRRQAQELQSLKAKCGADILPSKDLAKEHLGALLRFRYFVDQAAKGPLNQLEHSVIASPPMRKFLFSFHR